MDFPEQPAVSGHTAVPLAPFEQAPEDLPAAPLYGKQSIAEVFTSSAASLGLPGFDNSLHLPPAQRVCVVLADGLGRNLLKKKAAHTPFLRSVTAAGQGRVPVWLDAAFPSTTASSLASLGTGRTPGEHGMVGYDVLDPAQDKVVNLLGNWDARVDPLEWQPFPSVFERAAARPHGARRRGHGRRHPFPHVLLHERAGQGRAPLRLRLRALGAPA
jgi:hypothetical protein